MATIPAANFPTSVWDSTTSRRVSKHDYIEPGPEEFLRLTSEIIALQTHLRPTADDLIIWVAPWGVAATATGAITNPYKTLAAAFAAISTTKKTIALLPGTYALADIQPLPVTQTGVKIIGVGGPSVTIITGANKNQALSLTPGAQDAAFTISIEGITVNQYAAKKGLYIDDTDIDGTVTVNIKNCNFVMSASGSSIDLLHAEAQAVTINCEDCSFTGPITVDCINTGDVFNFNRCKLLGGLASDTADVAASFLFKYCEILDSGVTGGHASQTIVALYCMSSDNTLAATGEFAGSHTETLIAP